jgi:pyruvate-formate lyase-activating enzyme
MTDAEMKKLTDLRVVDLKAELEKRSLEVTGVKNVLVERLEKVCGKKNQTWPTEWIYLKNQFSSHFAGHQRRGPRPRDLRL